MLNVDETKMNKTAEKSAVDSLGDYNDRTPMTGKTANGIVTCICFAAGVWYGMCLGAVGTNARIAAQNIPVTISYGSAETVGYATAIMNGVISGYHRTETMRSKWSWSESRITPLLGMVRNREEFCAMIAQTCCIRLPIDPKTGTGVELARFNPITKYISTLNAVGEQVRVGAAKKPITPLSDIKLADWVKSAHAKDVGDISLLDYLTAGQPPLVPVGDAENIDLEANANELSSIIEGLGA